MTDKPEPKVTAQVTAPTEVVRIGQLELASIELRADQLCGIALGLLKEESVLLALGFKNSADFRGIG